MIPTYEEMLITNWLMTLTLLVEILLLIIDMRGGLPWQS